MTTEEAIERGLLPTDYVEPVTQPLESCRMAFLDFSREQEDRPISKGIIEQIKENKSTYQKLTSDSINAMMSAMMLEVIAEADKVILERMRNDKL